MVPLSLTNTLIFGQNTRGNLFIIKNVFRGHDPTLEAVFELARPIFPSHQSSAESELTMTPSLSVMDGKIRYKLWDQCASEAKAGTQETPGCGDKEILQEEKVINIFTFSLDHFIIIIIFPIMQTLFGEHSNYCS